MGPTPAAVADLRLSAQRLTASSPPRDAVRCCLADCLDAAADDLTLPRWSAGGCRRLAWGPEPSSRPSSSSRGSGRLDLWAIRDPRGSSPSRGHLMDLEYYNEKLRAAAFRCAWPPRAPHSRPS